MFLGRFGWGEGYLANLPIYDFNASFILQLQLTVYLNCVLMQFRFCCVFITYVS